MGLNCLDVIHYDDYQQLWLNLTVWSWVHWITRLEGRCNMRMLRLCRMERHCACTTDVTYNMKTIYILTRAIKQVITDFQTIIYYLTIVQFKQYQHNWNKMFLFCIIMHLYLILADPTDSKSRFYVISFGDKTVVHEFVISLL